ncbi:peptidoglycan-binding protein [Streptomyces platensis]
MDAMIAAAAADVGYKEGRNNDTKHGRWYGLNFNPWCDMAVSMWADKSGNGSVVGRFAYCPSHVNWFRARGQFVSKYAAVKRGDIVFYTWDGGPLADHVGIVVEDSPAGHDINTIEGNTSSGSSGSQGNGDGCYRRTRSRSQVLGFGRPAYAASTTGSTYKVKPGETLSGIGARLGIPWQTLATLNGIRPPYVLAVGRTLKLTAKPRPYAPFPGAAWFKANPRSPLVTAMGRRLVAEGCSAYGDGPGPQWTESDRKSYAKWQRKRGFSGADADGWPGKSTWDALKVPAV